MKKIGIYAVITVFLGLLSACLDDDNNYNYIDVNEVQGGAFSFKNFEDSYSILEGDEMVFTPTFKFSIDSIQPDVRYEWYLDRKLLADETTSTYTFKAEKCGIYQLTFAVIDNKSGIKYGKSTYISVRSLYQRGWTILSEEEGTHRSVLHFIIPTSFKYTSTFEGKEFTRDSIFYQKVRRDFAPNLGTNPTGLLNNVGDMDCDGAFGITLFDEMIVKQDRWVELNGNTMEREVYTDEEFYGDIPENFSPVEGSMTYSAKVLRNSDGMIYWQHKSNVVDFHAGAYLSIPLDNSTKFSRLFPAMKFNRDMNVMLAVREKDNSFVGILDRGHTVTGSPDITQNSIYTSGNVHDISEDVGENHFRNIKSTIVDAFCITDASDITYCNSAWIAFLKDDNQSCQLRYFALEGKKSRISCTDYCEVPLGVVPDFRDVANFGNRRFVVYADGNQLYYCQYGKFGYYFDTYIGEPMKLGEPLPGKVKKLEGFDLTNNEYNQKYPYPAQLGVALEDGSFYIFGITEKKVKNICKSVELKQEYPNSHTSEENKKFGNIIDVKYKLGNGFDYRSFAF